MSEKKFLQYEVAKKCFRRRFNQSITCFGYQISRQTGSHIRITTSEYGTHHVTVPNHNPLRIGTFAAILDDIAGHFKISRQEFLSKINI